MTIKTLFLAAAAAVPLLAAAPSFAADLCTPTSDAKQPAETVLKTLQDKGYRDLKLGTEHGCYEAKGYDAQGKRVEIYVHPNTGEIVKTKGGA